MNLLKHSGFSKIMRLIRILGMMAAISYMTVTLFTWIYADIQGYVYFSAGEPVSMIRYPEWVLGFIGIFVAIGYLHNEIKGDTRGRAGDQI